MVGTIIRIDVMNVPFGNALVSRISDLDIRKSETAVIERLDSSLRVGRRSGAGAFVGEVVFMPTDVFGRGYRDALRRWVESVSLLGNYTDLPLGKAGLDTLSTTRSGTTAWDSQRQEYVVTLTANDLSPVGSYCTITYNGTPRLFRIEASITSRKKVLWPNVHIGTAVLGPANSFRCYCLEDDADVFIGMGGGLSDDFSFRIYEHIG